MALLSFSRLTIGDLEERSKIHLLTGKKLTILLLFRNSYWSLLPLPSDLI